jgi:hypothetical protein
VDGVRDLRCAAGNLGDRVEPQRARKGYAVLDILDFACWYVGQCECGLPVGGCTTREPGLKPLNEVDSVSDPVSVAQEPCVPCELRLSNHVAQPCELSVVAAGHGKQAIFASERLVRRDGWVLIAKTTRRFPRCQERTRLICQACQQARLCSKLTSTNWPSPLTSR